MSDQIEVALVRIGGVTIKRTLLAMPGETQIATLIDQLDAALRAASLERKVLVKSIQSVASAAFMR